MEALRAYKSKTWHPGQSLPRGRARLSSTTSECSTQPIKDPIWQSLACFGVVEALAAPLQVRKRVLHSESSCPDMGARDFLTC
eukprot:1786672-Amphidinium_carterae.2